MNKALISLVVLGAVALTSPALAKSAAAATPASGVKIAVSKTTAKVAAPLKHKHSKCSIKKTK
ncbi:hypothetical protein BH10CYA1_BH10CYA1_46670 [soil metagenome]